MPAVDELHAMVFLQQSHERSEVAEKGFNFKLSGNEVPCTNALLSLIKIILSSRLLCHFFLIESLFQYNPWAIVWDSPVASEGVPAVDELDAVVLLQRSHERSEVAFRVQRLEKPRCRLNNNNCSAEMWSGSEEGSCLRLVDCCITQLQARE